MQSATTALSDTAEHRLLRIADVCQLTSLSRSSIYEMAKEQTFPRPVAIGANRVAWRMSDVVAWINTRQQVAWAA